MDQPVSAEEVLKNFQNEEGKVVYENLPWFFENLTDLKPDTREVFEKYCKVSAEQVVPHITQFRNKAFKVFPYPCLGRFGFLDLSLRQNPAYGEVLQRVKSGDKYLDIGCCVGQDIRALVFDGAPSENTYGADLEKKFMEVGYELFMDKPTLKTTLIEADIFNPESDLKQLDGQINVVHAASFFHLFSWDGQVKAAKRVVLLLKNSPGSMIVGRQAGNVEAGEVTGRVTDRSRFQHNPESFAKLWKQVGIETGTEWKVEASLGEMRFPENGKPGFEFATRGMAWLTFMIRKL